MEYGDELHSDTELEREIEDQLSWDYRIDASNIQIHVTNGNVLLTGTVPADVMRILITRDVAAIPGVIDISNQLEVGRPLREILHDDIRSRLLQMLRQEKDLDISHIKVNVVEEGMVILEGETDTYREKKRIEDIVTSFVGTVGIENRITITPKMKVRDENIAQEIIANILADGLANMDDIDVRVEAGNVTVTGSVPTWTTYNSIYEAVTITYGVRHINMNIDIKATI